MCIRDRHQVVRALAHELRPGKFLAGLRRAFHINAEPVSYTHLFGEPEELLGTLRFLIDDKASGFVTGITIPVDGGFSAYSGV